MHLSGGVEDVGFVPVDDLQPDGDPHVSRLRGNLLLHAQCP